MNGKVKHVKIPVGKLCLNNGQINGLPRNPRFIRNEKFKQLCESVKQSPEFLDYRPIIAFPFNDKYIVIAGNMRLRACRETGFEKVPCIILNENTSVDKLREYAAKDNISFGQFDFEIIADEWNIDELSAWGQDIPDEWKHDDENDVSDDNDENTENDNENTDDNNEDEDDEDFDKNARGEGFEVLDVLYPSNNDYEIPTLLLDKMAGRLELPITPWGANSRLRKDVNTYHFYVDDYRFEQLFKDPVNLLMSGVKNIVEPNCSLHDQTPIAWGLHLIYKKRWLARYCQEVGISVYVDLNVAPKFSELNTIGVPHGWDAFFTRGIDANVEIVEYDFEIAKKISGKQNPNFIVYGGGKEVQRLCQKLNVLYVHDFINAKNLNNK